jgi:hypothetical protein
MAQTPRNDKFLVRCVAQSLSEPVETIFSDLALLVAVTEPSRRQVWFAALALLETDGRLRDQVKHDELIAVLLSASNERILKMVRSEAPPRHYLSAITRLGNSARTAQTYALLWTRCCHVESQMTDFHRGRPWAAFEFARDLGFDFDRSRPKST